MFLLSKYKSMKMAVKYVLGRLSIFFPVMLPFPV